MKEVDNRSNKQPIFTKKIHTNHRTYFFDVRNTRNGQKYITINEVRKKFNSRDGRTHIDKSKIFLYGENFDEFVKVLEKVIGVAKQKKSGFKDFIIKDNSEQSMLNGSNNDSVNVSFEDLGGEDNLL